MPPEPIAPAISLLGPRGRRALLAALCALGLFWLAGLVVFVRARPPIEVRFPRPPAAAGGARRNLAHFSSAPTLRVSSVHWALRHHPAYLADGNPLPTPAEKWVSAPGDPRPWIEVRLQGRHDVDEVRLQLAGIAEAAHFTMRRFLVECFRDAAQAAAREVRDNLEPRPRVPVRCPGVDLVRVTFQAEPRTPRDLARVYEIEVYGR